MRPQHGLPTETFSCMNRVLDDDDDDDDCDDCEES